jgi:hypothetical protein
MGKTGTLSRDLARLLKKHKPSDLVKAIASLSMRAKPKSRSVTKTRVSSKKKKSRSGIAEASRSHRKNLSAETKRSKSAANKSHKRPTERSVTPKRSAKVSTSATRGLRKQKASDIGKKVRSHDSEELMNNSRLARAHTSRSVVEDGGDDYSRWFRIISGEAASVDSDSQLAKGPGADQPKEWKKLSSHLRMRSLLLSGPFKLGNRSSGMSTTVTFLPNGAIGIGETHRMARWRLSKSSLELLDMSGAVQSRFELSHDGRFLTQVQEGAEQLPEKLELLPIET